MTDYESFKNIAADACKLYKHGYDDALENKPKSDSDDCYIMGYNRGSKFLEADYERIG